MNSKSWSNNISYNEFMGKWSTEIAKKFLQWLGEDKEIKNKKWIDIGCGTGALTFEINNSVDPAFVLGIDPTAEYLPSNSVKNVVFKLGKSQELPAASNFFDFVVSGLALNFMPDKNSSIQEMLRVLREKEILAIYVWDYSDKMEILRYFWDAVVEIYPDAIMKDEGQLFPICKPEALLKLFNTHNLIDIETSEIVIDAEFQNFEAYWTPFLGGQGPAGKFIASLNDGERMLVKNKLKSKLLERNVNINENTILKARAFAIRGKKP